MLPFKILDELKHLIPALAEDEFKQLESNCLNEGIRDPLVIAIYPDQNAVEQRVLADGHNRYRIANTHKLTYKSHEKQFDSFDDVKLWMIDNQNGRRNLSDWVRYELIQTKKRILAKRGQEKCKTAGITGREKQLGGLSTIDKPPSHNTQKEIATDLGWSTGKVAMADKVKTHIEDTGDDQLAEKLRTNEVSINQAYQQIKKPKPHVTQNSGNDEWYTPSCYIESARKAMGSIDLDPASSSIANERVDAAQIFTIEDDGLSKIWHGNVWLNPPYSQPLIGDFIDKLQEATYTQAIVLVNNATETKWGNKLLSLACAVCFNKGRIRFLQPDGSLKDSPLQGQMIVYIGNNVKQFISEFSQYGICLKSE